MQGSFLMQLIVDANILFAAIIRPGATRRIWFNNDLELYSPKFILQEFNKYREELMRKYRGSPESFNRLLDLLIERITLIHDSELAPYMPAAADLSKDAQDWLYLACALKINAAIWTNDKAFRRQKRVKILSTESLMLELG